MESGSAGEWAVGRTVGFADPRLLDPVVRHARVIGFAEFAHLQPECLTLRNRVFRHLVESAGVTAIAAETSFTRSIAVDDYVLGRGEPRPTPEIVQAVFSWSPHAVAENTELIEWMRGYNLRPSTRRPVRFYGIDLTGVRPGNDIYAHAREGADLALAYVARLAPREAARVSNRLDRGLARFSSESYATLSAAERTELTSALSSLSEWIERSQTGRQGQAPRLDRERAGLGAQLALQHDAGFRADPTGSRAGWYRDEAMASNLDRVLEQEGPQGRILLFASLNHLSKGPNERYGDEQLGVRLAARLREDYVVIGTYWTQPMQAAPIIDAFGRTDFLLRPIAARIESPLAVLDLRDRPPDVQWRGARGTAHSFVDAVVFIRPTIDAYEW
jgi:erythromycin esterase-like protein